MNSVLRATLITAALIACPLMGYADGQPARVLAPLGQLNGHPVGTAGRECVFNPLPSETHEGEPITEFSYALHDGRYAHVRVLEQVAFVPESFRLTVRGNGDERLLTSLRVQDAQGEQFNIQPDEPITAGHEGWKTFAWSGGWGESWGPNANGKADAPLFNVDLFFTAAGDDPIEGAIALSSLVIEGPAPTQASRLTSVEQLPVALSVRLGNAAGDPKFLHLSLANRGDAPISGRIDIADRPERLRLVPAQVAVESLAPGATLEKRLIVRGERLNPYNRYRFRFRFSNDLGEAFTTAVIHGDRSEGVNLGDYRDSTTIPASPFGVGTHFNQGYDWQRSIPMLRAIGVKWVREGVRVRRVDGRWQIDDLSRRYLKALDEAGINVCCVVTGPMDPDEYADQMRYLVSELGDQIKVWEIWNEPHNFDFRKQYGGAWNSVGDAPWARKYVELVMAASKAIRDADPDAVIIAGDDVPPNNVRFFELGMGDYVDGVTHHPYNYGGQPPETCIWGSPDQVKRDGVVVADPDCSYASLITHTHRWAPGKEVWITEYGYDGRSLFADEPDNMWKPVSEQTKAKYFARWYLLNFALGVDGIFQHTFQDGGDGPMGLVRDDFSPKPAYHVIGRIFGLFDSTWKLSEVAKVSFDDSHLPEPKESLHPDRAMGQIRVPTVGGIFRFAWEQPDRGELAVAYWHAGWPDALRPPIGRTMKIKAPPGYGHPIRVDTLTGEHLDFPPTRVDDDGTMVWENTPVPDYPIVVKLFAYDRVHTR